MANDDRKPQTPPAHAGPMEPIRVRELRARREDDRLPLPAKSNVLRAGPRPGGGVIRIQYEPWQRHHRVREVSEAGRVTTEVCIPESWVAYTPDEGPA